MTTSLPPFPVGVGFRPTDEELITHYLKNKLLCIGNGNDSTDIPEVDFYKYEPSDLVAISISRTNSKYPEWCFLCPREYKYAKSKRINRATKGGFWKPTGKDRKIKIRGTNKVVGIKKTLVYYERRAPDNVKTNYVMHEYDNVTFEDNQRTFVICRLMRNVKNKDEDETNIMICDDNENQETREEIPNVCGSPEVNMEYYLLASPHEDDYSFPENSFIAATNHTPYFETENSNAGFPIETDQENNVDYISFFNSNLEDDDVYISEGTS